MKSTSFLILNISRTRIVMENIGYSMVSHHKNALIILWDNTKTSAHLTILFMMVNFVLVLHVILHMIQLKAIQYTKLLRALVP